ncbi:MAG: hypothetical protein ACE5Q6_18345 [Dehalococcoidia bacterium]
MTTTTTRQYRNIEALETDRPRTSAEMLTEVSGSIPTTGLVLLMALSSPVYSHRPVLFIGR